MKVVPIVEGHGEVGAVPVLLRRLASAMHGQVTVARPIRQSRGALVKENGLRLAVQIAAKQTAVGDGILILLDADRDCPAQLGPKLLAWAHAERSDRKLSVMLAKTEFEAWFACAAESLVVKGKLPAGTTPPVDPEAIRDAKGWIASRRGTYSETIDQPAFASLFDLAAARACPSFDKLWRDFGAMLAN